MLDMKWSPAEKKIARAAYDRAYQRECDAILLEVKSMLASAADNQIIWRLEEYLRDRRREIDRKYDFRYSVLMLVFISLYAEGWLKEEDLAGLSPEKIYKITHPLA
jgi:hypothetical protein